MKKLSPGTEVRVESNGRIRHAIVVTVTDQNTITARIGQGTAVAYTRQASTTTRGTLFA